MWIRRKMNMRNINVSQVFGKFSLATTRKLVGDVYMEVLK